MLGQLGVTELASAVGGDLTGASLIGQHHEFVAGLRHFRQTLDFHGNGGARRFRRFAVFVVHGTHAAIGLAGQHHIADLERAGLHQHRGHRATALVELGLDHQALGHGIHRGLQFKHFRLQQHLLQQLVDAHTGFAGNSHERRVAAVFFGHHFLGHQLLLDLLRVGFVLVGLGNGNNNRHLRRFGVLDGFTRLGHHTVVGRAHQNDNVRRLGTTGTHGREGLVTGGVEERHHTARRLDVVSANVLSNATGLAHGHLGAADVVQQRGLAVVHVAHHGNHRSARQQLRLLARHFFGREGLGIVKRSHHGLVAHFLDHDHGRVLVQRLVDGDHLAHLHQRLDHLAGLDGHLVGQFGHRDGLGHMHFNDACLDRRGLLVLALIAVIATAATRTTAPAVAPDAATGIAPGLDFLLFGGVVGPAGRQLGGLDLFACTTGGSGRSTGARTSAACGRLVQRALLGVGRRRSRGLGLFHRLLGHQHLLGRGHHSADGFSLGQCLAATFVQVLGACRFLCGTGLGLGFSLCPGLGLGSGTSRSLGNGLLLRFLTGGIGLGLLLRFLRSVGGSTFLGLAFATLTFLAFAALLHQLFFLAADRLSLAACLFLAAHQLLVFLRRRGVLLYGTRDIGIGLITLDERALLAHLDLDRARTACGIGLLDLTGGFLDQRDLLALGCAMAGLQVGEQLLLVRLGQCILRGSLDHPGSLELLQEGFRRFFEFSGKLGDSIHRHIRYVPP